MTSHTSRSGLQPSRLHQAIQHILLASALSVSASAQAETRTDTASIRHNYHISGGSLGQALRQFATNSGLLYSAEAELTEGKTTNGLDGEYTAEDALKKLLVGTGLTYTFTAEGAVAVRVAETVSNAASTLPAVKVVSESVKLFDGSYTPTSSSTATKTNTPLIETPQTVQVVTKEIIIDKGIQKPNDLAEVVAGVQPIVGYGNAASQWFLIRGFSNSGLNFRNGYRLTELYTPRDLANVERVEFAKGPASVLYGSNQPGGAVNTVTKRPLDLDFVHTAVTGGSFDRFRGTIDANKKIGDLAMRLNVAGDQADSYFDFEHSQNWLIAPTFSYNFTPDTRILYEGEFQEYKQTGWSNGLPNLASTLKLPQERTMSEPFTFLNNFNQTHRLDLEHNINADWRIRQGVYYAQTQRDFMSINSDFSRSPGEPITAISRFAYQSPNEQQNNLLAQTELYGHFQTGSFDHQILTGFETRHATFEYVADFNFYDTLNLVNPTYNGTVPAPAIGFGDRSAQSANAVYLQDQVKWDNWRLLAGWRHDDVETSSKDPLSTAKSKQSEGADTGRAGLLYMITPSTSVYYSFSQSFSPNLGVDVSRRQFKADRGNQHEVGVKHALRKNLDLTVSLFDLQRENVVGPDPKNPGFRLSNGDQSSQGIETSLLGDLTADLHVISNLTWMDTKVEKSGDPSLQGDRLYGVPKFSANAWALYDLPLQITGKLSTGFGIVHVGEREATLPNFGLKLPDYTRYDMGLFYKYKNAHMALNLRNLTDEKYYETVENYALQAQAPFNWAVTVGYDF
jgi:iron complex outermembrane receptor protein